MSDDTVRPDKYNDETNRMCTTNVHSNKLHLPSEPKDNQPLRLLVGVQDMQRSNLITSQQAVAPGVMMRSSTAGSRPSTFAAALSVSKNAKDVIAVASKCLVSLSVATPLTSVATATTGHTRRP
ncbi:hypothetical protein NW761_014541 [Fusarium oxysporum]|nr:hypothetical protein NW761_014541 [Fusarium oxysporum]